MGRKRQDKKAQQMYQLYRQGYSLEQVGKAWGIKRQSVYSTFVRRGWALRTRKKLPSISFNGHSYTVDDDDYYRRTNGDRSWLHQDVWEFHHGPIPTGYEIHHKSGNRLNNDIANLECLTPSAHAEKHHPFSETPEKYCLFCGKKLERKRQPSGRLETPAELLRRRYCDAKCRGNHIKGKPRGWKPE